MKSEYRVVWKRTGNNKKHKKFGFLKNAERWVHLLTSDEPWIAFGKKADDFVCCPGNSYECDCGGKTVKQDFDERKPKDMPPIEFVRLEERALNPWSEVKP